jgi:hypothetical protein
VMEAFRGWIAEGIAAGRVLCGSRVAAAWFLDGSGAEQMVAEQAAGGSVFLLAVSDEEEALSLARSCPGTSHGVARLFRLDPAAFVGDPAAFADGGEPGD